MNTFQEMVEDIIKKYKNKLSFTTVSQFRVDAINEMKNELLAMKQTWEILHPTSDTSVPSFEEVVKQIN